VQTTPARPVDEQQKTLNAKLRGHYQYYGRPTNYRSILAVLPEGPMYLARMAGSPHPGHGMTWERFEKILRQHPLVPPRIMYSWAGTGSSA